MAVMLVVGGCGSQTTPGPPTATEPEESVTDSEQPSPDPSGGPVEVSGVVADAVRDLAGRLGVDASAIDVVTAEEVTWRDGSMGCPQPGMMYPQVLIEDGVRVVLEAEGRRYEYHAGGGRSAFLCEDPQSPLGR